MSNGDQDSVVRDNPDASQYEIFVGDQRAGYSQYRRTYGHIAFTHTVIEPAFERRGLGGVLAAAVLDAARADNVLVRPYCPFIADFIRQHPVYADLVDPAMNFQ